MALELLAAATIITTMQRHFGYFWRFTFTLGFRGAAGVV
jgi:hypothetical protein